MNKIISFLAVVFPLTLPASAQDAEVTTYFGEKNGFQIDIPATWTASLQEQKVMFAYNTVLIGLRLDMPGSVIDLRATYPCKNSESQMKTWVSIFEKEAKKSKDQAYKVHDRGEGTTPGGKDFSYFDYTYTLVGEDGTSSVLRRKFYVVCHSFKGTRYQFAVSLQSMETDWDKVKADYEKIFASIRFN